MHTGGRQDLKFEISDWEFQMENLEFQIEFICVHLCSSVAKFSCLHPHLYLILSVAKKLFAFICLFI